METSILNGRQEQAAVESDVKKQAGTTALLLIDLDLLDDNPFQPRTERDEIKASRLRESIAKQGQLQPILVRRVGSRWQIIFGHCRVEALRRLRNEATTETARAGYSKVRAEERSDVSDEQMLLLGMENIQREDISPVDSAAALVQLHRMRPELQTSEDIARTTGMEQTKVKRLLRFYVAPQVIKDAVSKGKTFVVPIGAEDSSPQAEDLQPEEWLQTQETRKLDLSSALSLARLHKRWCETQTDQNGSTEGTPDERMAALIDRVLKQEWGVRRVRLEVAKLAGEVGSPRSGESSGPQSEKDTNDVVPGEKPAADAVAFKVKGAKLVIFTLRVPQMNDAQKAELRSVLQPIRNQLGGQIQLQPAQLQLTEDREPLHWIGHLPKLRRDFKEMAQGLRKLWRIFLVYVAGLPPDKPSRPVQLPSYGDSRSPNADSTPRRLPSDVQGATPNAMPSGSTSAPTSERQPAALPPTAKTEPMAKPPTSNGSEQRLSS